MNVYEALADLVAAVHLAYVGFVVVGMLLILLGIPLRWRWVRNFWFRIIHFLMIVAVVIEALVGVICPLTTWEKDLRKAAGVPWDEGSFVGRLVHYLMFCEAPEWVFTVCYCVFGGAVLVTLLLAPPRWPWRKEKGTAIQVSSPSNGD